MKNWFFCLGAALCLVSSMHAQQTRSLDDGNIYYLGHSLLAPPLGGLTNMLATSNGAISSSSQRYTEQIGGGYPLYLHWQNRNAPDSVSHLYESINNMYSGLPEPAAEITQAQRMTRFNSGEFDALVLVEEFSYPETPSAEYQNTTHYFARLWQQAALRANPNTLVFLYEPSNEGNWLPNQYYDEPPIESFINGVRTQANYRVEQRIDRNGPIYRAFQDTLNNTVPIQPIFPDWITTSEDTAVAHPGGQPVYLIPAATALAELVRQIRQGNVPGVTVYDNRHTLSDVEAFALTEFNTPFNQRRYNFIYDPAYAYDMNEPTTPDFAHLTPLGTYMMALVNAAVLFHMDPRGATANLRDFYDLDNLWYDDFISTWQGGMPIVIPNAAVATIMENIAYQVVTNEPRTGYPSSMPTDTTNVPVDTNTTVAGHRPIGVNLMEMSYFSTNPMLKNVKKLSSRWLIQDATREEWNIEGVPMPTLSNGYPTQVPFNVNGTDYYPHCIMLSDNVGPHFYPSGDFTVIITGSGQVEFEWDGNATFTGPGTFTLPVATPSDAGLHLRILSSDVNDPITNIEVIYPGEISTYPNDIFSSHFVTSVEPFDVIRFMKPNSIEENPIVNWSDRTTVDDHSYFAIVEDDTAAITPGIPWELVVQFCNEHDKDPWICLPYQVNDDYVTQLATLFRDNLEAGRQLYLEYSNETWNYYYVRTYNHVVQRGLDLGFDTNDFTAGLEYYTHRSLQIFELFASVFGNNMNSRVTKVLASGPWDYPAQVLYESLQNPAINPNNTMPDALAMAPYVGLEQLQQSPNFCNHTAEQLLDSLFHHISTLEIQAYFDYGDSLNIPVLAYEGGQHLAATGFQAADTCVARLIREVNLLPGMQEWYCEYYDEWYDNYGGGLHVAFSLAAPYNEYGSFGILESQFQDYNLSPKWQAHEGCVFNAASNADCSPVISLDITPTQSGANRAVDSIISTSVIRGDINIHYYAGQTITLLPGFEVSDGATFVAAIGDSCTTGSTFTGQNLTTYEVKLEPSNSDAQFSVKSYPNPVQQSLFIPVDFQPLSSEGELFLFSAQGQLLLNRPINLQVGETVQIDFSNYPSGLYFYQLVNGKECVASERVVKQRF
ncbi:MAG: T9SS type A sorting domain-containing protein [Bacteroidota bacterium]